MIGQQPRDGEWQSAAMPSEDVRQRAARAIKNMRIASTRAFVVFMTMIMVFGTTPAQLWAEGAEGIAQTVASQDAEPTGEGASAAPGDEKPAGDADASDSSASSATQENEPQDASQPAAKAEAAIEASAEAEPAALNDDESDIATAAYVTVDSVSLLNAKGQDIVWGSASNTALKAGETIKVGAYYEDDWGDDAEIPDSEYAQLKYQWYVGEK